MRCSAITSMTVSPFVSDADHQLAAEDAEDLLAGVQVHTAGITGRDAATGDQQALQAVGVTGDKAETGSGGQLEGREVRHAVQCPSLHIMCARARQHCAEPVSGGLAGARSGHGGTVAPARRAAIRCR
jgi:hypothetical protein